MTIPISVRNGYIIVARHRLTFGWMGSQNTTTYHQRQGRDNLVVRWKWDIVPVVLSAGFAGLIFKMFFSYYH